MFVFVLPFASVTVIVLLLPSSNPHVAVAVQSTVPLAVTGSGLHVIHATVTVDPGSTLERLNVTVSHVCAGFGERLTTVGSVGAVVSTPHNLFCSQLFTT